jgi:hypothetical protein
MQTPRNPLRLLLLLSCWAAVTLAAATKGTGQQPGSVVVVTAPSIVVPATPVPPPPVPLPADQPNLSPTTPSGEAGECCPATATWGGRLRCGLGHVRAWADACWGERDYFQAESFGGSVDCYLKAQIANGQAAQLMLYHFDFGDGQVDEAFRLNVYGHKRLKKMASLLAASSLPLMIEETIGNDPLDAARRQEVLRELNGLLPAPISPDRVVVMAPVTPGLRGVEALLIYNNLMRQTTSAASRTATAGGGAMTGGPASGTNGTGNAGGGGGGS